MKLLHIALFAVLAVVASAEDKFYKLFKAKAPIEDILKETLNKNSAIQYKHFSAINQHIVKNDQYAPYAKQLKAAAQSMLNGFLKEIKYKGKVDIADFVETAYNSDQGLPVKNQQLVKVVNNIRLHLANKIMRAMQDAQQMEIEKALSSAGITPELKKVQRAFSRSDSSSGRSPSANGAKRRGQRNRKNKPKPAEAEDNMQVEATSASV